MTIPGASKSRFITYVMQREVIDREHSALFQSLHLVQQDAGSAALLAANITRLEAFGDMLRVHHISEQDFLDIIDPEQATLHAEVHAELERQALQLVASAKATCKIDLRQLTRLAGLIETHIETLDHQLQKTVDLTPRSPA